MNRVRAFCVSQGKNFYSDGVQILTDSSQRDGVFHCSGWDLIKLSRIIRNVVILLEGSKAVVVAKTLGGEEPHENAKWIIAKRTNAVTRMNNSETSTAANTHATQSSRIHSVICLRRQDKNNFIRATDA